MQVQMLILLSEFLVLGNPLICCTAISCSPPLGIIGGVEVKCSQTEDCTAMLQHHRNSFHFLVSFSRTRTEQLRDKLYRKIKECLPRGHVGSAASISKGS